jgi:hypothetical protein
MEPIQIWARIGKPHAFFLPPILFTLGAIASAQSTGRFGWYGIAGIIAGLGCFLSPVGPSLAIGTFAVIQGTFFISKGYANIRNYRQILLAPSALFALGALLGAAPILVQRDYFDGLAQLNLRSPEAVGNRHLLVQKTVQSLFSFLSHDAQGHFMAANPFNLILATFILGCLLVRGRAQLIWLSSGLALCFGYSLSVGGLSQYAYPPTSRIHLLAIPFCWLATIGISQLLMIRGRLAQCVIVALCLTTLPLTLLKITQVNPVKGLQSERLLIVRAVQRLNTENIVVLLRDNDDFIKRIITAMQTGTPPKHKISYINNTDALSSEELSAKLSELPAGSGIVVPDSLPTTENPAFARFTEEQIQRYAMRLRETNRDPLSAPAAAILKLDPA